MFGKNAIRILCALLLTASGIVCGAGSGQSLAAPDKSERIPLSHVEVQPQEVRNIILFS
jgi:hypothetical protein